ncbi:MAG: type IV pilin protein [Burkholderiaceae bacterium]|nr:type IV pilin protein [Burkholderiaceae bacterium]
MNPPFDPRAQARGFTLIELMIVVAIVALLATVAYPSYMAQIRKARRSDAVQALAQVQQAQERWRSVNVTYAPNAQLTTAWPGGLGVSTPTAGGYYTIAIGTNPAPTGVAYVATATAVTTTSQNNDTAGAVDCKVLTMTVNNGTAVNTPVDCWSK